MGRLSGNANSTAPADSATGSASSGGGRLGRQAATAAPAPTDIPTKPLADSAAAGPHKSGFGTLLDNAKLRFQSHNPDIENSGPSPFAKVTPAVQVPIPENASPQEKQRLTYLNENAKTSHDEAVHANSPATIFNETGKNIINTLTSSEQGFGASIAAALPKWIGGSARNIQGKLDKINADSQKGIDELEAKIREARVAGKDTSRMEKTLNTVMNQRIEALNEIVPSVDKTAGQVFGEAGGVALDLITPGELEGGAKSFGLFKNAIHAPTEIKDGFTVMKNATARIAGGAATGYGYDVSQHLQEGKTGQDVLKPGLGTLLGTILPAIPGVPDIIEGHKEISARLGPAATSGGYIRNPFYDWSKEAQDGAATIKANAKDLTKEKFLDAVENPPDAEAIEPFKQELKAKGVTPEEFYDTAAQKTPEIEPGQMDRLADLKTMAEKYPDYHDFTLAVSSGEDSVAKNKAEGKYSQSVTQSMEDQKLLSKDLHDAGYHGLSDFHTTNTKTPEPSTKEPLQAKEAKPADLGPRKINISGKDVVIPEDLRQKGVELEIRREVHDNNPLAALEKHVFKRGEEKGSLPEIGGPSKSKFAKSGDKIIQEAIGSEGRTAANIIDDNEVRANFEKYQKQGEALKAEEAAFKDEIKSHVLSEKDKLATQKFAEQEQRKSERDMTAREKDTRLAERQAAFDEGVKNAKAEAERQSKLQENRKRAYAEQDPELSLWQKLRLKLNPLKFLDKEASSALTEWNHARIKAPVLGEKEMKSANAIGVPKGQGLDVILEYQSLEKKMAEDFQNNLKRGMNTDQAEKAVQDRYGKERYGKYHDAIKTKFDALYEEAKKRGFDPGYKENYLPGVYKENPGEIRQKIQDYLIEQKGMTPEEVHMYMDGKQLPGDVASNLRLNPFFSKEKTFPDYRTAMEYGLTPKYTDPDQLAAHYRTELEKAVANKELIDKLVHEGKLIPEQIAPASYVPVKNLPLGQRGYYAKPRLADVLDGIFRGSDDLSFGETVAHGVAKLSKFGQEIALSAGIPGTNVNYFSMGQLIKQITAGDLKAIPAFIRSNFNDASIKFFEKNQPFLEKMADQGINIGDRVGNFKTVYDSWAKNFGEASKNPFKKETYQDFKHLIGDGFDKLFNRKTFNSFMPQLYTQTFKDTYLAALKNGMTEEVANKLAGDTTKNFFGLTENVGRSRMTQDSLSAAFFAPRFREGIINTLMNTGKAGLDFAKQLGGLRGKLDPSLKLNRRLLTGMVISYGLYNALNYKLNGHFMWDNPSGRQFALRIPGKNGTNTYIEFMPSFLAFARNLAAGGIALAKGDPKTATQKFGSVFSMPLKVTSEIIGNSDYYGNQIYKDTDTGVQKAEKIAAYVGLAFNHPYVQQTVKVIQGTTPLPQAISTMLELPLKFSTNAKESKNDFYDAITKLSKENAKATRKIQPIYDNLQKMKAAGDVAGANKIYNALSKEDKAVYNKIKSSAKTKGTTAAESQIYTLVSQLQEMKKAGKTKEVNAVYDSLTADEKKAYQKVKKRFFANQQATPTE